MSDVVVIPEAAKKPAGSYVVPYEVPHFGGSLFKVPDRIKHAGLVIYASGLATADPQPMALAIHPDFLYLADVNGMIWARQYQLIKRVDKGSQVTVTVPIKTRQGQTGWILDKAETVSISFPSKMGGGEISLVLATLIPQHASLWVARINQARLEYEERFDAAA